MFDPPKRILHFNTRLGFHCGGVTPMYEPHGRQDYLVTL